MIRPQESTPLQRVVNWLEPVAQSWREHFALLNRLASQKGHASIVA
jgi:hypothetical protein